MLALDGGGIRGMLSLGILGRIEKLLAEKSGRGSEFRLSDYFDYIAGTSTGAIIAAGLARGMAVAELVDFYRNFGQAMFEKEALLRRLHSLYTADPLRHQLQTVFGQGSTLEPSFLKTLLLVVTRNATTDSPWPISSHPGGRYNDPGRLDCNLRIPLWQIVRASTAAPIYFPPEIVQWSQNDPSKSFVFVDGGMTPYNNPAFLLYRMATQPPYLLNWETGERKLLLISVGTGVSAELGPDVARPESNLLATGLALPGRLMYAMQVDQDINCRTVGRCVHGDVIDRELLDMIPRRGEDTGTVESRIARPAIPLEEDLGRAFLYARYNADLSAEGLSRLGFGHLEPKKVQALDGTSHDNMEALVAIGAKVGEQARAEHFGPFV
jgi:hypothetical protein